MEKRTDSLIGELYVGLEKTGQGWLKRESCEQEVAGDASASEQSTVEGQSGSRIVCGRN